MKLIILLIFLEEWIIYKNDNKTIHFKSDKKV